MAKGYSAVFPDGIRRSRVAVLWLPHAARIDHQRPSELRFHRLVRVAQEEEIGVSGPRQFSFPATRRALLSQIVVKRVARRGMAGDTRCARALEPLEGLPAGEKALHLPGEAMTGGGLHGCGQTLVGRRALRVFIPAKRPVVIALDNTVGLAQRHCPRDTLGGLGAVVDQVAEAEDLVGVRLRGQNGLQGGPVAVNVGYD